MFVFEKTGILDNFQCSSTDILVSDVTSEGERCSTEDIRNKVSKMNIFLQKQIRIVPTIFIVTEYLLICAMQTVFYHYIINNKR